MESNAEKLNDQAIDLAAQGQYREAIACFLSAIRLDKKNYTIWYNLGITYRDSGDFDAAKDALTAAYKLAPENEDILETLSLVCYADSEMEDAYKWAYKALEVNFLNPHVWNNIGVFHFSEGEFEEAAESFEKAVSVYPHYYDALYNLRDTYIELGNKLGAKECDDKLKELSDKGGIYGV